MKLLAWDTMYSDILAPACSNQEPFWRSHKRTRRPAHSPIWKPAIFLYPMPWPSRCWILQLCMRHAASLRILATTLWTSPWSHFQTTICGKELQLEYSDGIIGYICADSVPESFTTSLFLVPDVGQTAIIMWQLEIAISFLARGEQAVADPNGISTVKTLLHSLINNFLTYAARL